MIQERRIRDILGGVNGFVIGDDGTLTLKAMDGRTIGARR